MMLYRIDNDNRRFKDKNTARKEILDRGHIVCQDGDGNPVLGKLYDDNGNFLGAVITDLVGVFQTEYVVTVYREGEMSYMMNPDGSLDTPQGSIMTVAKKKAKFSCLGEMFSDEKQLYKASFTLFKLVDDWKLIAYQDADGNDAGRILKVSNKYYVRMTDDNSGRLINRDGSLGKRVYAGLDAANVGHLVSEDGRELT